MARNRIKSSENGTPATVLIVDDTVENLKILSDLLLPIYQVLAANSGERALQLANTEPRPDLILLDVMMPEMDGYTVLTRLKENPATREIPVIFVTAMDATEDEQYGLDLGAADYIVKPLKPPIVMARVRTQLELKQARDWLKNQNSALEAEVTRRAAETELILTSAAEGIYGTDTNGVINFINPAGATLLGYERQELLNQEAHTSIHHSLPNGRSYSADDCPLCTALASGLAIFNKEEVVWRKDGSPLPVEISSKPIHQDSKLIGAVVTFMDISERKSYLAQLERQSNYDELTSLPNRNLLRDRLTQAIERSRQDECSLSVLLLGLDRFKEINDTLGHGIADQALQRLSKRLRGTLQEADTLARVSGDEFVILLNDGESIASLVCNAIQCNLSEPFSIDDHDIFLTASIGIAVFPKDGDNGDTLLKNAAAAMYKVKAAGGNSFRYYTTEMNARSLERLNMTSDLRRALQRDELVLYYQPQVNLRNGEIIGGEALLRWRHPKRGLVPPGQFIPLAEDTGLIVAIGEWVLRTACLQNKAWHEAGLPPITLSVNVSAHQFAAQNVVKVVETILHETGIDPSTLELELTESAVMADAEQFVHATKSLKELHVPLTIDDFGTGFSSLSYLKRFALDRLKIDISFVRDITQDPNSASIAQAIISLAHNLRLSVIAEGVETEAQLNFLRARGCDEMQGFYFSKPIPAAEFEQLLRERRKLIFPPGSGPAVQTILLVDDEANILSSLQRLLRRKGYNILTAQSGLEGLEQLARHDVGVVISDLRMSKMGGAEFLSKVRAMYPATIRIMLSAYSDVDAVTDAVNMSELYKFFQKPWNDDELLETLREAFRHYETRRLQMSETGLTANALERGNKDR